MQLFYEPNIEKIQYLSADDSRHCIRVLRHKKGDFIRIVDGIGGFFKVEITNDNPKKCEFKIIESQYGFGKRDYFVHLAIAPTKNSDRLEWMIEKCVEIGIDEISLIQTKHSERKNQKIERLEKIAIAAMKQSINAYLPKINGLIAFENFIKNCKNEQKFIAHLTGKAQPLHKLFKPKSNYCIIIGPEGDFTNDELNTSQNAGFEAVTLGSTRLRTETAGLVACTILNINQH